METVEVRSFPTRVAVESPDDMIIAIPAVSPAYLIRNGDLLADLSCYEARRLIDVLNEREISAEDVIDHVLDTGIHIPEAGLSHTSLLDIGGYTHDQIDEAVDGCIDHSDNTAIHAYCTAGWVAPTLLNSWQNYGTGTFDVRYRKLSFGLVVCEGLVQSGLIDTVIFTLPAGCRPGRELHLPTNAGNTTAARIKIETNGNVSARAASPNPWFGVNFCFFADQ